MDNLNNSIRKAKRRSFVSNGEYWFLFVAWIIVIQFFVHTTDEVNKLNVFLIGDYKIYAYLSLLTICLCIFLYLKVTNRYYKVVKKTLTDNDQVMSRYCVIYCVSIKSIENISDLNSKKWKNYNCRSNELNDALEVFDRLTLDEVKSVEVIKGPEVSNLKVGVFNYLKQHNAFFRCIFLNFMISQMVITASVIGFCFSAAHYYDLNKHLSPDEVAFIMLKIVGGLILVWGLFRLFLIKHKRYLRLVKVKVQQGSYTYKSTIIEGCISSKSVDNLDDIKWRDLRDITFNNKIRYPNDDFKTWTFTPTLTVEDV